MKFLAQAISFTCLMLAGPATAQQPEIAAAVAFTEGPAADREATSISPTSSISGS